MRQVGSNRGIPVLLDPPVAARKAFPDRLLATTVIPLADWAVSHGLT